MTGTLMPEGYSRREWATYFDAVAVGVSGQATHCAASGPTTWRSYALYADVAAAGLARVKAAIEAYADMTGPRDRAKWH